MMSNRQYRNSLSSEQCRTEIFKNAGIMYDPDIAHTVVENWEAVVDFDNYKCLMLNIF
nr:hypothetical protein [Ruminiclostridium sufflavum]